MGKISNHCTIVSGAPNENINFLKDNIDANSFIIAADSGYIKLQNAGIKPDLIIGDFDSAKRPEIDCEILTFPVEKAYSDTFNCVVEAIDRGYDNIDIYFAIGGNRFDHTYSNLLILEYCRKHNVYCRLIDDNNRLSLIIDQKTIKKEYQFFSIFAYLCNCHGVTIEGAYYDQSFYSLDSMDIMVCDNFAQSNQIIGSECTIRVKDGVLLLVESND
ncbi:MAG: thiamine diphosphokinase [Eubacterium sp.]